MLGCSDARITEQASSYGAPVHFVEDCRSDQTAKRTADRWKGAVDERR
jgi:hypothetical protein